jgi:hypothetical protein
MRRGMPGPVPPHAKATPETRRFDQALLDLHHRGYPHLAKINARGTMDL